MKMKTITINGQKFRITDDGAVRCDEPQQLPDDQQLQAQENIGLISTVEYGKYFDIDYDGIASIKSEYRGAAPNEDYCYAVSDNGAGVVGSKIDELPEKLVIPDVIDGTAVTGLQAGAFYYNNRVKEITIPDAVTELPERFCSFAKNMTTIKNTEQVTKLGNLVFNQSGIEKAMFPNLKEWGRNCFTQTYNLYLVDIGDNVSEISMGMFGDCVNLSVVKGGAGVRTIGKKAFTNTYNLKNLPLLSQVTYIGILAFYRSRIQFDWSTIADQCTFEERATPVIDNKVDYWSGVSYKPCDNGVMTTMQQTNPLWKDSHFGEWEETYEHSCHIFAILHIHSALSGKLYNHPDEFAEEVSSLDPSYLTNDKSTRTFDNVEPFFTLLGYKTTVYTEDITEENYQAVCDALERGAYVYQQVSGDKTSDNAPEDEDPDAFAQYYENAGHAAALYGINSNKEVLVVDSGCPSDITLYRMPFENLTGPSSNLVIVEKGE